MWPVRWRRRVPLVLLGTLGIGIAIGSAGAIPSMIVAQRMPGRPALGTGAYAGGIVAGSTLAAGLAVPLAVGDDWRRALMIISLARSSRSWPGWSLVGAGRRDRRRCRRPASAVARPTGWLLVVVFGLQSVLFYGIVSWLPNAFVERGWSAADAGALIGVFNGVGLLTTIGVPLVADRLGSRRHAAARRHPSSRSARLVGIIVAPDLAFAWVAVLGLSLGAVFPLVLTLPLDVADDPARVGSVAALMLLGGYVLSSTGPVVLGAARDVTGDFGASMWMLVGIAVALVVSCLTLSPARFGAASIERSPA